MSRNLARTDCHYCGDVVVHDEKPRAVTRQDAGAYFKEVEGMLVAVAHCVSCEAQYLAWVTRPPKTDTSLGYAGREGEDPHMDLSYRSTFNDEPGVADLPKYEVEVRIVRRRVGPYPVPEWLRPR